MYGYFFDIVVILLFIQTLKYTNVAKIKKNK